MDAASSGAEQENIINGQVQLKTGLQSGRNRPRRRNKKRVQSGVVRKNITLDSKFIQSKAQESEKRLLGQPRKVMKPSQLHISDFHNTSRDSGVETPILHKMKSKLIHPHNDKAISSNYSHLDSATMASQDPVSSRKLVQSIPNSSELVKPHTAMQHKRLVSAMPQSMSIKGPPRRIISNTHRQRPDSGFSYDERRTANLIKQAHLKPTLMSYAVDSNPKRAPRVQKRYISVGRSIGR